MSEQDEPVHDDLLRGLLSEGDEPAAPLDGPALLTVHRRKRNAVLAAAALGLMLAGLGASMMGRGASPEEERSLRPRGGDTVSLEIEALIEGPAAQPRLWSGDAEPVGDEEAVVFVAIVSAPGFGCIEERFGERWMRVLPEADGVWALQAGRNVVSGPDGGPLAFRTDHGPGARAVRLVFSADDPSCAEPDGSVPLELRWAP